MVVTLEDENSRDVRMKKKSKKSKQPKDFKTSMSAEENNGIPESVQERSKHKKRKRSHCFEVRDDKNEGVCRKLKKIKTNHLQLSAESCVLKKSEDSVEKLNKKKKKKERKETKRQCDSEKVEKTSNEALEKLDTYQCEEKVSRKSKSKKKKNDKLIDLDTVESIPASVTIEERNDKKTKKKSKSGDCDNSSSYGIVQNEKCEYLSSNISESNDVVSKKRKKKKKRKDDFKQDENDREEDVKTSIGSNKDRKIHISENATEDKKWKKKKSKQYVKDPSETEKDSATNTIHEQTTPSVGQASDTSRSNTNYTQVDGQWKGELFQDNERQNKFLRLLGGMKQSPASPNNKNKGLFGSGLCEKKKGLFGSLSSLVNKPSSGSNVAMSASAAASLNQSLEDEYNRALNLKLGKGKGCGFGFAPDPAEGKTFHIDLSKVKSMKFAN